MTPKNVDDVRALLEREDRRKRMKREQMQRYRARKRQEKKTG